MNNSLEYKKGIILFLSMLLIFSFFTWNSTPHFKNGYELLNGFSDYFNKCSLHRGMKQKDIHTVAKNVVLEDGNTVFDNRYSVCFDGIGIAGWSSESPDFYIGDSSKRINNETHVHSNTVILKCKTTGFDYPFGIKHGDSYKRIINIMGLSEILSLNNLPKLFKNGESKAYIYGLNKDNEHIELNIIDNRQNINSKYPLEIEYTSIITYKNNKEATYKTILLSFDKNYKLTSFNCSVDDYYYE